MASTDTVHVRVAGAEPSPATPPQPGGSRAEEKGILRGGNGKDLAIATWNIRDGRNGGLESAARSFKLLGVDIGIVQETKCVRKKFAARKGSGYAICSINTGSSRCG